MSDSPGHPHDRSDSDSRRDPTPDAEGLQPEDDTTAETATVNLIRDRQERHLSELTREAEARVRRAIKHAEAAIAGERDEDPYHLLESIHYFLWHDDTRPEVMHPRGDAMDRETRRLWRRMHQRIESGEYPEPTQWLQVLASAAIAMGFFSSITDKTQYAPVYLEAIPGVSDVADASECTPVGRRRIAHDEPVDPEAFAVEIPHHSCDHILAVAAPRSGKDATLASIGANLTRQHNYKYVSILDDGRNETPMLAIPNDEAPIRENLNRMDQEPAALPTTVYVPAMGDVPARLPANHELFTIGIADLTAEMILRLAGVTKPGGTAESLVGRALEETLQNSREVTELESRLRAYADEVDHEIEWTELKDREAVDGGVETYRTTFTLTGGEALKQAADQIAELAGKGLIASPDAETNLDFQGMVEDNETAAVLNANHLDGGDESLKFYIMDLWLQALFRVRDENPRVPRIALEIRELKTIAPSKLGDARYKDAVRVLRQTLFFLSTQGGSRGVLLLGSTQKLTDVYKPVRSNMLTKILLRLDEETIQSLHRSYKFSDEVQEQLAGYDPGKGMAMISGHIHYPIEWRGSPTGLGDKDRYWRDRYGLAWGARVREQRYDGWRGDERDPAWWVDVNSGVVFDVERDGPPPVGEWYLLPEDLPADAHPDLAAVREREASLPDAVLEAFELPDDAVQLARGSIRDALEERREYPVPSNLRLVPTDYERVDRTVTTQTLDDRERTRIEAVRDEYEIPVMLTGWLEKDREKVRRMREVLKTVKMVEPTTYQALAEHLEVGTPGIKGYANTDDELAQCMTKRDGVYVVTDLGDDALAVDWEAAFEMLADLEAPDTTAPPRTATDTADADADGEGDGDGGDGSDAAAAPATEA